MTNCYEYFKTCYEEYGWIFDKDNEEVFMIIDKEINLNEGDRVNIAGIRLVEWKCVDILGDFIEYALEEE